MSPRLAAIGVATLSGLILQCLDNTITPAVIKPNTNDANDAVTKLLAINRYVLSNETVPFLNAPNTIATNDAKNPTTIA